MKESDYKISVVISTCNRCKSLKEILDSLLIQENDNSFNYEVIVVDNNSKDKTKDVVESYIGKFNGWLRYVFEPQQGLSYARNRGISAAKGEIIAFSDDDCIVDKGWLRNIFECFQKYDCAGVGGKILPLYHENTPMWIKENKELLQGPIVFHDYGEDIKIYTRDNMVPAVGANMAFSKQCFNKYGLFRTDLGAGRGSTGEDTEFFRRLEVKGVPLYYCGKALVWHKVANDRMGLKYIAKWQVTSGRYLVAKNYGIERNKAVCYFGIPRYLIREILQNSILSAIYILNKMILLKLWMIIFTNAGMMQEYRRMYICQRSA